MCVCWGGLTCVCHIGIMILLKGTAYNSQRRDTSGLIWVTQAETAIRSNQSQGSFANSLLIMYNTSLDINSVRTHENTCRTRTRVGLQRRTHTVTHTQRDWDRCTQLHTHTRTQMHPNGLLYIRVFSSGSACSPVQSNPTAVCPAASQPASDALR